MKQIEADSKYLSMAKIWATNSHAKRLKVGAIIVKDKMIISDGFNGTPSGFDNWCEDYSFSGEEDTFIPACCEGELDIAEKKGCILRTKPDVVHAEANAIAKVARSTQSSEGATIYVTHAPCVECAKLIIQSGIKRVVFGEMYRSDEGIKVLKKANIKVEQLHVKES